MASTPEQVVCTPTFVFPAAFPVNGFPIWKEEQKDVLTLCNSTNPWTEYRGFDPRQHLNFHVATATTAQTQTLQHPEDNSKSKISNRGNLKTHLQTSNNDFATRNLLVAAASAPPAFPGIDVGLKIPNPNIEKQHQQQQQQAQQQQHQQQQTQHQQAQQQPPHQPQQQQHSSEGEKERLWPCPSCKVPFKQASELQAHLSAHTKGEKTVPCDICGKFFASGDRVRIHVKAAHGEKSCSCEICGSGFSYRCKLLDHMRTHTGDKPFHCDVCGKSFSQKNHLTRHSMIHTGERPYPCDFCGRGFYRKDKLNRHRRIHTGERVTGQPRQRRGGHFNSKMSPGTNRHSRGMAHHSNSAPPPNGNPQANVGSNTPNAIKMESLPDTNASTTTSTSLSFAPPTLTPAISPSHYRASPYKPQEWQGPPSGVH